MIKKAFVICSCLLALMMASCGPKDPIEPDQVTIGKGVFVINEGNFTYANSSLTFYNPETDTVANNLFYRINGAPIGDVGQSLALIDKYLYIVVNNSNYIYKVNAGTMVCDTTKPYMLTDFVQPRYMLPVAPDKAYVSDLASTELWIVNPKDMTHTGSVNMNKATETMVQVGNELYVTNWSKSYVSMENNTVQVVDINNNIKVEDIRVGLEPNGMVVDKYGMVWVLCEGAIWTAAAEDPTLWRINPMTKQAFCVTTFSKEEGAMNLAVDPSGTYLYYFLGGDVHRMNVDTPETEDNFVIASEGKMFYKIAVNPENGDIYITDAKTYVQNGTVYRYSSDGVLLSSFDAGICPGFMLFN
jgi:DNA-binding beta-propeller fold protein YncE